MHNLEISDLHVSVEKKEVLKNITLEIAPGEVHALMGPNGSGKSTLSYTLAGHPHYEVTQGIIKLCGRDIKHDRPDRRAREGLFVAFQQVPVISGLSVFSFLKEIYQAVTGNVVNSLEFKEYVLEYLNLLNFNSSFLERSLYEGFSGGEKKRLEVLQLLLIKPKVAILDEIDSGVDIDSLEYIAQGIQDAQAYNPDMSVILITHYQHILQKIKPDYVHVLMDGTIIKSGDIVLARHIEQHGYQTL